MFKEKQTNDLFYITLSYFEVPERSVYVQLFFCKKCSNYSTTQTGSRGQAMDTLPSINDAYLKVYIRSDDYRATSWSLFLNPLSYEVWFALILVALGMEFVVSFSSRSCSLTLNSSTFLSEKIIV